MRNPLKHLFGLVVCVSLLGACSTGHNDTSRENAKDKDAKRTTLESFMGKRGKMQIKDSYSLGSVTSTGRVDVSALVLYEPNGTEKTKGIRIEVTQGGRTEQTSTSFLDDDELESLSQALSYMSDLAGKWSAQSRDPYTEVTYESQGEFRTGFYQKGSQIGAFCSSGNIGRSTALLTVPDLAVLKGLIDQAITLLKSK